MNLKGRGITVGDLLLTTIFIILTIFIVNKIKTNDSQSSFYYEIPKINTAEKIKSTI